nr:carboxypeptidase regulatory-like domain-containing protein [Pyrinomonadaceae bacterium]
MKFFPRAVFSVLFLLFISVPAFAQLSTGSMSGTVTDASGAVVPGARVTARQDATGRTLETVASEAGLYAFPNLDVGPYTVTVEQPGFKKQVYPNVIIAISNRTVADAQLEVGDLSQTVTVTADTTALQRETTEIGVNFSPKLFRDAPI